MRINSVELNFTCLGYTVYSESLGSTTAKATKTIIMISITIVTASTTTKTTALATTYNQKAKEKTTA